MNKSFDNYLQGLLLGCYPKNVERLKGSGDLFERTMYIDFELDTLSRSYLNDDIMIQDHYMTAPLDLVQTVERYLDHLSAFDDGLSDSTIQTYAKVVMANLYYLKSDTKTALISLRPLDISKEMSSEESGLKRNFLKYLSVRRALLLGLCQKENCLQEWYNYLSEGFYSICLSDVAAQLWLKTLFNFISSRLSRNEKLKFTALLRDLPFSSNTRSFLSFCCFLLHNDPISKLETTFASDLSAYLEKEIEKIMSKDAEFPNALSPDFSVDQKLSDVYRALDILEHREFILDHETSKSFLIYGASKTYRSLSVTSNMIKELVYLNSYDEALAAFETYDNDVEKAFEQLEDSEIDLLSIVDVYSFCLLLFNPFDSASMRTEFRFRNLKFGDVLDITKKACKKLLDLLSKVSSTCDLVYEKEQSEDSISFLYQVYNNYRGSNLTRIVSDAWFAIGSYYFYLAVYEAPTLENLEEYVSCVLFYYKRSLIVHTGNRFEVLFNYALSLAFTRQIDPAMRLVKFILKKYPNSFKSWNLLILLQSSLETFNPDEIVQPHLMNGKNDHTPNGSQDKEYVDGQDARHINIAEKPHSGSVVTSETYTESALAISEYYLESSQNSETNVPVDIKYEIFQLKLTQVAIIESIHGIEPASDLLPAVFALFNELFGDYYFASSGVNENYTNANFKERRSMESNASNTVSGASSRGRKDTRKKIKDLKEHAFAKGKRKRPEESRKMNQNNSSDQFARKVLQNLWLWTSKFYLRMGCLEEAEQCIVESETVCEPNIQTHSGLGLLCANNRKTLAFNEFEKSLDILSVKQGLYLRKELGEPLLGFCKLVFSDEPDGTFFISEKDRNSAFARLKNHLEDYRICWPHGYNSSEVWWYLSLLYERLGDNVSLSKCLQRCLDLEDYRPVRSFESCLFNSI